MSIKFNWDSFILLIYCLQLLSLYNAHMVATNRLRKTHKDLFFTLWSFMEERFPNSVIEESKALYHISWTLEVPTVLFTWPNPNLLAAGVGNFYNMFTMSHLKQLPGQPAYLPRNILWGSESKVRLPALFIGSPTP